MDQSGTDLTEALLDAGGQAPETESPAPEAAAAAADPARVGLHLGRCRALLARIWLVGNLRLLPESPAARREVKGCAMMAGWFFSNMFLLLLLWCVLEIVLEGNLFDDDYDYDDYDNALVSSTQRFVAKHTNYAILVLLTILLGVNLAALRRLLGGRISDIRVGISLTPAVCCWACHGLFRGVMRGLWLAAVLLVPPFVLIGIPSWILLYHHWRHDGVSSFPFGAASTSLVAVVVVIFGGTVFCLLRRLIGRMEEEFDWREDEQDTNRSEDCEEGKIATHHQSSAAATDHGGVALPSSTTRNERGR